MSNSPEFSLSFNLETDSPSQILEQIQSHVARLVAAPESENSVQSSISIENANGHDFVGAGIRSVGKVRIQGTIGDFCMCSFGDGECNIEGNVGDFFGHSIQSGILVVRGHAKNGVGAMGAGGLVTIYGNAGERVGLGMQGADIVIRGSAEAYAGLGMQSGTLIIGGNAGPNFGHQMRGGTIYLRGEAESLSPDIEEHRLREPDRLKIGLLMLKSGIKSTGKEFRAFRPVQGEN